MKTRPEDGKAPARQPESLAPAGHGPAAVVRDLARDLLRQKRIHPDEAGRIEAALRDHDWPTVRTFIEVGLGRRAGVAAAAPGPAAARAAPPEEPALAAGLLRLVMQLCDALPRLAGNDESFIERLGPIRAILGARLTPAALEEAAARLAALIDQQLEIQRGLQDARSSLKDTLSLVVNQLGAVGTSTARFQERVSAYREELAGPPDAGVLARVAGGLIADTQAVTDEIQKSQKELAEARRKVESYELRVRSLEHELAQTSRLVQNDSLTHVLNRRGLDDVFRIEVSRASRYRVPLTLVMIDLDDFKSVNDSLGHAAGDRALVHFVTIAQAVLRSTELIARTGGEEFVVVFPATGIASSLDAIRRLQRELARSAFPYEGQLRVLTFSGGAAEWREGESLAQILRRADAAMYRAKNAGKDRVAFAE